MDTRNASGIHIEVWERRFFLRVDSFSYAMQHYRPARRPAISVVVALGQPFRVAVTKGAEPVFCRSMIVGPDVLRDQFEAVNSDLWVFDAGIDTPEFRDLATLVAVNEVRILESEQHEHLVQLCHAHDMRVSAKLLLDSVVYSLCERGCADLLDARIMEVLSIIENLPAEEVSVGGLARAVHLSESRLRALFRKEMSINLSRYVRFVGMWKAILLIVEGQNFTDAAHAAGFHDLPHFNRVVTEFSGFSPTAGLVLFGTLALQRQRRLIKPENA